jgi:hypothetical protein
LLNLQVLALSLIPLFSGGIPASEGIALSPLALLGMGEPISTQFIIGTWKYSDDFFRWGITDKAKAKVKPFKGNAFMSVHPDGTVKMVNLFRPAEGRWELSEEGMVIYDPERPERVSHILPIRKRDRDRIWVLLPFTGGASGIGMVRVSEENLSLFESSGKPNVKTRNKKTRN